MPQYMLSVWGGTMTKAEAEEYAKSNKFEWPIFVDEAGAAMFLVPAQDLRDLSEPIVSLLKSCFKAFYVIHWIYSLATSQRANQSRANSATRSSVPGSSNK